MALGFLGRLVVLAIGAIVTAAILVPLCIQRRNGVTTKPTTAALPQSPSPTAPPENLQSDVPHIDLSLDERLPLTTSMFQAFVHNFASKLSSEPSVWKDQTSAHYKAANFIANVATNTTDIVDRGVMEDFYALAVFYYATGGDDWKECSQSQSHSQESAANDCPGGVSWMTPSVPHCDWHGISCNDAGRVIGIMFIDEEGNNLIGTLPSELGLLTELEQFAVMNDRIEGYLPETLGALTHLTHFILVNTSISGTIPDTFLENSPVEGFMVSDNQLEGSIPRSLVNMTSIYQMFLDNNRFSGPVPEGLGYLSNLATLDLSENHFSGEIPSAIFSPSLQNLYLGESRGIQGSLSSAIGNARNLRRLHITGTRLSGKLPDELFGLSLLTEIVLSDNALTGSLSSSVGNLGGTLETLMLDGNEFSGDLPNAAIENLTMSNVLSFDRNAFEGAISLSTCRRKGGGYRDLQVLDADCEQVTCSCCNNCVI